MAVRVTYAVSITHTRWNCTTQWWRLSHWYHYCQPLQYGRQTSHPWCWTMHTHLGSLVATPLRVQWSAHVAGSGYPDIIIAITKTHHALQITATSLPTIHVRWYQCQETRQSNFLRGGVYSQQRPLFTLAFSWVLVVSEVSPSEWAPQHLKVFQPPKLSQSLSTTKIKHTLILDKMALGLNGILNDDVNENSR